MEAFQLAVPAVSGSRAASAANSSAACPQPRSVRVPTAFSHGGRRAAEAVPTFVGLRRFDAREFRAAVRPAARGPSAPVVHAVTASAATDFKRLARMLCSDWDNKAQAWENPSFWSHIRVGIRPIPQHKQDEFNKAFGHDGAKCYWLWLENAYEFAIDKPYRVAAIRLAEKDGGMIMENYKIKGYPLEAVDLFNTVRNFDRIEKVTAERLEFSCGCSLDVVPTASGYKGTTEPGKKCVVERKGVKSWLQSDFEVTPENFYSLDVGRSCDDDAQLWGSVAGRFAFDRKEDWSAYVA
eukprot:tig00021319_g20207.t1